MKGRGLVFYGDTETDDLDDLDAIDAQLRLDHAVMRAAWSRPFHTGPAQSAAPAAEARADRQAEPKARPAHQAEARTTRRNAPPANLLEALRRLLDCNRNELAARLGVSRQTLHRWERGQIPGPGAARVAELLQTTLGAAMQPPPTGQERQR